MNKAEIHERASGIHFQINRELPLDTQLLDPSMVDIIEAGLTQAVNETIELCATAYIGEYDLTTMSGLEAKVRAIRRLRIEEGK